MNKTERIKFLEEQLFEAKRALFTATSIKRVKFIQNKIRYLNEKLRELTEG